MKLIIALILGVIVSFALYKKAVFSHKEKSELYEAGAGVVTAAIAFALLTLFAGGSPTDVADEKLAVDNDVKVTEKEDKKDKEVEEVKEKDVEKYEDKDEKDVKKDVKDKDKDSKKKEGNEESNKKADSSKKADNKASDIKKAEAKKNTSSSNVKTPSKGSSTKPSAPSKKPSTSSKKPTQSKPSAPKPAPSKPKPAPSKPKPNPKPSKTADKVEYKKHKSQDEIYYSTKYEDTDSLYIGEQKVKVKGRNGYVVTEYTDKYVNGQWVETTTKVVEEKDKIDEVILTGTKVKKHINDSESRQIFNEVNAHRKANGLPQLQWDEALYKAAKVRAEELIDKLDHTRPNGTSHSTAIDEAGVVYEYSGENIAAWHGSVNEAMSSWKSSPAHNGNMLSSGYTHMASAKMESSHGNYWVQIFINR